MSAPPKVIRDFIYLDVDRLYSLASQVFEGVVAQIAQSFRSEQTRSESQKRGIDEQVAEAALRTENRYLHDHLYHQLEEHLSGVIVDVSDANDVDYSELIANGTFIRVRGSASIDDYSRLAKFTDGFNDLGMALAYLANLESGEIEEAKAQLETTKQSLKTEMHSCKNALAKSNLRERLSKIEALEQPMEFLQAFAAEKGMHFDSFFLHSIKTVVETFRADTYEINVTQAREDNPISFRNVLNKQWLRLTPEYLRSLYGGGFITSNLVVIGQITAYLDPEELDDALANNVVENATEPSLTDAFQKMFSMMSHLDGKMSASKQKMSLLVQPLAIYKEIAVPAIPLKANTK